MPAHHGSPLIARCAAALRDAWVVHREVYTATVKRAKDCFQRRDWNQLAADTRERAVLYSEAVDAAESAIRDLLGEDVEDIEVWVSLKAVWSVVIAERQDWDLAETFFNSITRRVFHTVGADPTLEFVDTDFDSPPNARRSVAATTITGWVDTAGLVERIVATLDFTTEWEDRGRDAALAGSRIARRLMELGTDPVPHGAEVLEPVFYRGHLAFVIARMDTERGPVPLVLAIANAPFRGMYLDAVLLEEDDVSKLFSFARSAFQVDVQRPYDTVRWLHELLPRKYTGELYISLGHPRHGKTALYRDLAHHLATTDARFVPPEGTPGLVMVVFELREFGWVFKVIRDRFPPEKRMLSKAAVQERYAWVEAQDRGGRIIDAQRFEQVTFPRDRFSDDVLDELMASCSDTVTVTEDEVVVALLYMERRVTPLNVFLQRCPADTAVTTMGDYARALGDLAACNIFPGDLLLKNFGVTRHGRVVFYDYDEVVNVTGLQFREIPEARTPEEEMSSEPWFSVGPNDIFPEEFPRFLAIPREVKRTVMRQHGQVFEATWWRRWQRKVVAGELPELTPYSRDKRLPWMRQFHIP